MAKDNKKTKKQLCDELEQLRKRVHELEEADNNNKANIIPGKTSIVEPDLKVFYENILNRVIDGVWVTDRDDVITYANKSMGVLAGVLAEQIVGKKVLEDFSETTLEYFRPEYLKAKESLKPLRYSAIPVKTPAGRKTYQSGWLVPLKKDGIFAGLICTVEDVTGRKLNEKTLQESEAKFQKSFFSNPFPMTIADEEGKFVEVNEAWLKFVGFTRVEVIEIVRQSFGALCRGRILLL
ncbi:PAS domain-containing protein [Candidatus Riflebacteria bacterium]